jgi:hypothetical protein
VRQAGWILIWRVWGFGLLYGGVREDEDVFCGFLCSLVGYRMVDANLLEIASKILWAVSFIAIGGGLALMFVLVFAQSILGSKTIHSQLETLLKQNRQICEQLEPIIQHLEKDKKDSGG